MSFTRLQYDTCSYKQELGDNVSILGYLLDTSKYNHCSPCRAELGLVGGNNVSQAHGNLVDIENDLLGINRGLSKCASGRFLPRADGKVQGKDLYKCTNFPVVDTTLQHLPSCQFFEYSSIPIPPQFRPFTCAKK
jgi:hypothetical protein